MCLLNGILCNSRKFTLKYFFIGMALFKALRPLKKVTFMRDKEKQLGKWAPLRMESTR